MLKSRIVVSTEQEGPRTLLKESYYNAPYKVVHYGSPCSIPTWSSLS